MTDHEEGLSVAIVIPGMPSRELAANSWHANHFAKSRHVKQDRQRGEIATKAVLNAEEREMVAGWMRAMERVPYRVTIGLAKGAKHHESDNVAIWPKALRDGIAAALAGEAHRDLDRNWELIETKQVRDPEKFGYTAFEFFIEEVS